MGIKAEEYNDRWQLPHCVGSLDGKHVRIQKPANGTSMFYNYKKYESIVLLAACDAKYNFSYVCIGAYGSQSDAGIFSQCLLGQQINRGKFIFIYINATYNTFVFNFYRDY